MRTPSAKELSKILLDYQINSIKGGFFDHQGLGEQIAKATKTDENAPPLARMLCSFSDKGDGMLSVLAYWKFREEVQQFQVTNNISSVYWASVECDGQIIRYPKSESQLEFMPQDGDVLSRNKGRVLDEFLQFVEDEAIKNAALFVSSKIDFESGKVNIALKQRSNSEVIIQRAFYAQ